LLVPSGRTGVSLPIHSLCGVLHSSLRRCVLAVGRARVDLGCLLPAAAFARGIYGYCAPLLPAGGRCCRAPSIFFAAVLQTLSSPGDGTRQGRTRRRRRGDKRRYVVSLDNGILACRVAHLCLSLCYIHVAAADDAHPSASFSCSWRGMAYSGRLCSSQIAFPMPALCAVSSSPAPPAYFLLLSRSRRDAGGMARDGSEGRNWRG